MASRTVTLLVALALVLAGGAGCRQKVVDTVATPTPTPRTTAAEPATTADAPTEVTDYKPETVTQDELPDDAIARLNESGVLKTIYFDYDQDGLTEEARQTLQANATWLKANRNYRVRIGGHADDRGSIEYNISLGQRRADRVREYLGSLGVDTSVLEVVSYGEENPALPGQSEEAWSKNRRAEFEILSQIG